jgi:hypothetical protein
MKRIHDQLTWTRRGATKTVRLSDGCRLLEAVRRPPAYLVIAISIRHTFDSSAFSKPSLVEIIPSIFYFSLPSFVPPPASAFPTTDPTTMPRSRYTLYVENLSTYTRSGDIRKEMSRYGPVREVERDLKERCALVQFKR